MDHSSDVTVPETGGDVPSWARRSVILPTFVVVALIGGLLPSFSVASNVLILITGGALTWIGFAHKLPQRPVPHRIGHGVAWWLVPLGVFVVFELITFATGSKPTFPTLSLLADPMLDHYVPRSLFWFGWLYGFWGLCRR